MATVDYSKELSITHGYEELPDGRWRIEGQFWTTDASGKQSPTGVFVAATDASKPEAIDKFLDYARRFASKMP